MAVVLGMPDVILSYNEKRWRRERGLLTDDERRMVIEVMRELGFEDSSGYYYAAGEYDDTVAVVRGIERIVENEVIIEMMVLGPNEGAAELLLADLLRGAKKRKKFIEARSKFMEGKAGLNEAQQARKDYNRHIRWLRRNTEEAVKTLEYLGIHIVSSQWEWTREEYDACEELRRILNQLVDCGCEVF